MGEKAIKYTSEKGIGNKIVNKVPLLLNAGCNVTKENGIPK